MEIESTEWESVKSLAVAVEIIQIGIELVSFMYEFGKTNPVAVALNQLSERIAILEGRLTRLSVRVDEVVDQLVRAENLARARTLEGIAVDIAIETRRLALNPGDPVRAAEVAFATHAFAQRLLNDRDLWDWGDIRIVTVRDESGSPLGPPVRTAITDFKPTLALPVYASALLTFFVAATIAANNQPEEVKARFRADFERHLQAIAVRPDWRDDGREAVTLAERIRARISGRPIAATKFAVNGICNFSIVIRNDIERTDTEAARIDRDMGDPGATILCTIDPDVVLMDERAAEDAYGPIQALGWLEEILRALIAGGRFPGSPFIGVFGTGFASLAEVYAIARDGGVDLHQQLVTAQGIPMAPERPVRVHARWPFPHLAHVGNQSFLASTPAGDFFWMQHSGHFENPPADQWEGPRPVGRFHAAGAATRWLHYGTGFGWLYGIVLGDPGGELVFGDMFWTDYRAYRSGDGPLRSAVHVGSGWVPERMCPGSEGVHYFIRDDGSLSWFRHRGVGPNGEPLWDAEISLRTGIDWRQYRRLIPGGQDLFYAETAAGALHLIRHVDWQTGGPAFHGPFVCPPMWRTATGLAAAQPGEIPLG